MDVRHAQSDAKKDWWCKPEIFLDEVLVPYGKLVLAVRVPSFGWKYNYNRYKVKILKVISKVLKDGNRT